MAQRSATEVWTKYATTVEDLSDAWSFVMKHLESTGPRPQIHITPFWSSEDGFEKVCFEVSVAGMVEQEI